MWKSTTALSVFRDKLFLFSAYFCLPGVWDAGIPAFTGLTSLQVCVATRNLAMTVKQCGHLVLLLTVGWLPSWRQHHSEWPVPRLRDGLD